MTPGYRALFSVALVLVAAPAAHSAPYGREFQAADLAGRLASQPFAPCVFADGSRIELTRTCLRPEHWYPDICSEFEIGVRVVMPDGSTAQSFTLPEEFYRYSLAAALTCNGEDRITVASGGCLQVQTFDRSGMPLTRAVRVGQASGQDPRDGR